MCIKYKDKGHSKMDQSVPEHIYVYIYIKCVELATESRPTTPKKFLASLEEVL